MTFHVEYVVITARENTMESTHAMVVQVFLSDQFAEIVNMYANRSLMDCARLIRRIAISVELVGSKNASKLG